MYSKLDDTDLTLIPTAEVPLTNYYNNEILDGQGFTDLLYGVKSSLSVQKPVALGVIRVV
jgi:seryl-tRNA synthetase